MSKHSRGVMLSMIRLDESSKIPKFRQLCSQLRTAVLNGDLEEGIRLPSTRELAADIGVSRLTVQNTYEQLIAEGYLKAAVGSGTFVAGVRQPDLSPDAPAQRQQPTTSGAPQPLSRRCQQLSSMPGIVHHERPRAFHAGTPALEEFPRQRWARISGKHWRRAKGDALNYGPTEGYYPLREAIAGYLNDARGVRCEASQVLVTGGAQQAFCLATLALLDEGEPAWVEDPGHILGREALAGSGARIVPVPLDDNGLDIGEGIRRCAQPKLIMVTPSHQHPLGMTTSLARRLELLDLASRSGAWVLEDDYDSEFRYKGRPLAAMQGIDADNRVIYVGTFSKVLYPALRLAYMVVPEPLVEAFTTLHAILNRFTPIMPQAILSDFISEGYFTSHIRKMRMLYKERQQQLLDALAAEAGDLIRPSPTDSGMHLIGWLPEQLDDKEVTDAARAAGVDVLPLSIYCVEQRLPPGLLLGFSCVREEEMRPAAALLAGVIRSLLKP